MMQQIVGGQLQWEGVEEALNGSRLDEAVLHFLRTITAAQMLMRTDYYDEFLGLGKFG